jgi:hypothetical protein
MSIGMSPFEIVHGYKPRKPLDLLPMSPHATVSELLGFLSQTKHLHMFMTCIMRSINKFKQVMPNINFKPIHVGITLHLAEEIMS